MISVVRFCTVRRICRRCFSFDRINVKREARMLDRMLKKTVSQKKTRNNVPGKLKQEVLTSAYANEGTNRKTAALNKLYMEQIIELINSGPFASQITELGIEFTKVKITSCRSSIYVFWISNKSETPESEIAELLKVLKNDLQSQMGFLIHLRKTPFINFVKDLRLERQNIVEKLLEVADFGKEYQPTSAKKVVNPELNELQKEENAESLKMRQNVLGVDHAKIVEKIMQNVKRFQPINIKKDELQEIAQHEHPQKLAVFSKKLFVSFYRRKMYLDRKLRTREYGDSFIERDEPYDPEEEAEKHWEFLKFKDGLTGKEQEEEQYYRNLYDDASVEEDDDYCEERDIDDNGWCDEDEYDDDGDDDDNDDDDESGKVEKFNEKKK